MSALCAETDPEIFFPEKGGGARVAKELCGECDEFITCAAGIMKARTAVEDGFGILASMNSRQRRELRRDRDKDIFKYAVLLDIPEEEV